MADENLNAPNEMNHSETAEQKYTRLYEAKSTETPQTLVVPSTPAVDPVATELLETVRAMKAELESLKPKPQQQAPLPQTGGKWVEYLRAGEWDKAEEELTNSVRAKVSGEASADASAKAFEAMSVQLEVDRYLQEVRSKNPDIIPLEGYLHAPVQSRIQELRESGKIISNKDFIREYKVVVEDEVQKLRKITGQYRAAGTNEARTRQEEVRLATPLQPQSVSSTKESSQETPEPNVSAESYFTRRKAIEAMRKGMGPVNMG